MNFKNITSKQGFIIALMISVVATISKAEEIGGHCDKEWDRIISDKENNNDTELLSTWLKLGEKCIETGIYEFRLSNIYDRLGEREKAKSVTEKALGLNGNKYLYMNEMNKWSYVFFDLVESGNTSLSEYLEVENHLKLIKKEHVDWSPIYEKLSNVQLFMGKNGDAIDNAERALSINNDSWAAHRVLVIAYSNEGLHNKARPLISRAAKLNESLLADSEFMIMAAFTYISVNELDTAESVLSALLEREPKIKSDERFIKLVNHLRESTK